MFINRLLCGSLLAGTTYLSYPKILNWTANLITHYDLVDPEKAHELFIKAGELGILPNYRKRWFPFSKDACDRLSVSVWGKNFATPVGLAAGLDKDAKAMSSMLNLGFGFVEVGSVTPKPQSGNERPRVFRLIKDRAIINRYGFNSSGIEAVKSRLASWRTLNPKNSIPPIGLLGVNLGKNKLSTDPASDYIQGLSELGEYADYMVINISSPNTPGLRELQHEENMDNLLSKIYQYKNSNPTLDSIPLLFKIDPDITDQQKKSIAKLSLKYQIDGLIISNTTVKRPDFLISERKHEQGGLSGRPLKHASLLLLRHMYKLTGGKIVLIGVGGIECGEDAYQKIRSGATLVQLYSSIVFHGPEVVSKINKELEQCLERDKFFNIKEAIGVDIIT